MEHMAWKGRIKPGCKAEYQKRHAEIWPEMVKVLKDAGICKTPASAITASFTATMNCSAITSAKRALPMPRRCRQKARW